MRRRSSCRCAERQPPYVTRSFIGYVSSHARHRATGRNNLRRTQAKSRTGRYTSALRASGRCACAAPGHGHMEGRRELMPHPAWTRSRLCRAVDTALNSLTSNDFWAGETYANSDTGGTSAPRFPQVTWVTSMGGYGHRGAPGPCRARSVADGVSGGWSALRDERCIGPVRSRPVISPRVGQRPVGPARNRSGEGVAG